VQIVAGLQQNTFIFRAKTELAGCFRIVLAADSTGRENSKQDSYGAKKEF
jgi:hypothetical protein